MGRAEDADDEWLKGATTDTTEGKQGRGRQEIERYRSGCRQRADVMRCKVKTRKTRGGGRRVGCCEVSFQRWDTSNEGNGLLSVVDNGSHW